jgi:hypothetical protein
MTHANQIKVPETPLGQVRAEAISAIEGQVLTEEQRRRFREWDAASLSPAQQRAEIMRLYQEGAALK